MPGEGGVDGPDAVVAAGDQVGAQAAAAGEGGQGMPVAGDRLMPALPCASSTAASPTGSPAPGCLRQPETRLNCQSPRFNSTSLARLL